MPKPLPDHSQLILIEHIQQGLSLRAIERKHGLANGSLSRYAKIVGYPVRSKVEQIRADFETGRRVAPSGDQHWAFGATKDSSAMYAAHSERMSTANPAKSPEVMAKIMATKERTGFSARQSERLRGIALPRETAQKLSKTLAAQFSEHLSEREQMMQRALAFDDRWIAQHHFDCFILDFARPDIRVAFEVDNGGHKLERSRKRDTALVAQGWTILRIRYDQATDESYFWRLFRVAEKLIPDFQCPHEAPADSSNKYGVIVRCPENPTGLHVRGPNDPALIELAQLVNDRLESTCMSQN